MNTMNTAKVNSSESETPKSGSTRPAGSTDLLFSMILLLVFILCSVFTILIGSRVYENIRARNDASFYSDTALGYVTNKIRQSDSVGSVSIRNQDGCGILVLSTVMNDTTYETWIYTKDGALKELFSEKDSGLTVEDGLDVMECAPLAFSAEDTAGGTLLTITLQAETGARRSQLLLRSSGQKGGAVND